MTLTTLEENDSNMPEINKPYSVWNQPGEMGSRPNHGTVYGHEIGLPVALVNEDI